MRRFLDGHGFVEVETPILSPLASGAAARPFKTHHNALGIDLYARIAPELYLKRLLVGGFERVYELNRNFRNEGIDRTHSPEFTMLEFYAAYMDANGMMDFTEELLRTAIEAATGSTRLQYGEKEIDFGRSFERLSMKEAAARHWPSGGPTRDDFRVMTRGEFNARWLDDYEQVAYLTAFLNLWPSNEAKMFLPTLETYNVAERQLEPVNYATEFPDAAERITKAFIEGMERLGESRESIMARNIANIFEFVAEPHLEQPTFIVDFPKAVSPLSKASPSDASIAERFELYVAGFEGANGFSELNDPEEQLARFDEQMRQRERGDDEAMQKDVDYVRALAYGMPPAAGIGIGIDRVAMLLTNRRTIRDVVLFPHMRPQTSPDKTAAPDAEGDDKATPPE
jgi:lysyl-tRNA synthetase class 2